MNERIIDHGTDYTVITSSVNTNQTASPRAKMRKFTTRFLRDNKGVTAIEYALVAGLIAVVLVTSLKNVETALQGVFTSIVTALTPTGT
ncbi:Flp family type IVb pilin [Paraburkholderia sp. BCC1885]|uniref:Flp family type IVb pilin n=1 Tax=Paraburkholderia sp. BCC1885 TaxID=2562669 RepID=UPI0028CBB5CD|nr:Flp family type IVb pilin [Paraburkholderia sp. BCC1885]